MKYRLEELQKNGEDGWTKRVNKESTPTVETPHWIDLSEVNYRVKDDENESKSRPTSIADRLKALQGSEETWRDRIGEKDVNQFTVEGNSLPQVREGRKI